MTKLKIGDEAPEIVKSSLNRGEFKLSDLRGKDMVYLVFSRYFGCPICQLDFKELLERRRRYRDTARLSILPSRGKRTRRST